MDDQELAQVLRDGLAARAEDADTTAPVVDRARADVDRRRRTRWSAVGAAAAVAVIVGGVSVVAVTGSDPATFVPLEVDRTPGTADREWRTEYWADIAVDVPADWGYGGAPMASGPETRACYPAATVTADGAPTNAREEDTLGWVGRPIGLTDVCALYPWIEHSPQETPSAPYVWLGAAVEPGTVEYDNGYVQETLEFGTTTVTVGAQDAGIRRRVLSSARLIESMTSEGANTLCQVRLSHVTPGRSGMTTEGRSGALLEAGVCAYRGTGAGGFALSYAQELDPRKAVAAFAAAEAAPMSQLDCDYEVTEFVVLRGWYEEPFGEPGAMTERLAVYETGCNGSIDIGERAHRQLTPDAVEPLVHNGIPAVVYGPSSAPWVYDYFIGPQG